MALASGVGVGPGGHHQTRRRTNSLIKAPSRFDNIESQTTIPQPTTISTPIPTPSPHVTRSSVPTRLTLSMSSATGSPSSSQSPTPTRSTTGRSRQPQFPLLDSYQPNPAHADDKRHPRELVPGDMQWPPAHIAQRIRPDDLDDRLLMAMCQILYDHQNRALVPKEVAEVMFQRHWLHNAGTTPFAHISTCIRAHLRRCTSSVPPYPPILTSFELVGALTPVEVRAVGLHADERAAVKRGTLWYLDERVLGEGEGFEDPFTRCRREAGMQPLDPNPLARSLPAFGSPFGLGNGLDEDEEGGMGRGKRKRQPSRASLAAESAEFGQPTGAMAIPSPSAQAHIHRRTQSLSAPSSAPTLSVPRLRLRLSTLEESESAFDESDGQTSDAIARRKTKKKARKAGSEGLRERSPAVSVTSSLLDNNDETEDDFDSDDSHALGLRVPAGGRRNTFSSTAGSTLLADRLADAAISPQPPSSHSATEPELSMAICPNSLLLGPFGRPLSPHHLSASAPNLSIFSSFGAMPSPDLMEVEHGGNNADFYSFAKSADSVADADEADDESVEADDFHEAMLHGAHDFDFEWGSESFSSAPTVDGSTADLKDKAKREMSIELPEPFSVAGDASSTPATTPRSPAAALEPEEEVSSGLSGFGGMQATLCAAYDEEVLEAAKSALEAGTAESLASLGTVTSPDQSGRATSAAPTLAGNAIIPPSALSLELPPTLDLEAGVFSADYDFLGKDESASAKPATESDLRRQSEDRQMADDEQDEDDDDDDDELDEEEDYVNIKLEPEDGSGLTKPVPLAGRDSLPRFSAAAATPRKAAGAAVVHRSVASSTDGSDSEGAQAVRSSGLPGSPPDERYGGAEWTMHLGLDELDLDLGEGDVLGPESVGLEELDLAWGSQVKSPVRAGVKGRV